MTEILVFGVALCHTFNMLFHILGGKWRWFGSDQSMGNLGIFVRILIGWLMEEEKVLCGCCSRAYDPKHPQYFKVKRGKGKWGGFFHFTMEFLSEMSKFNPTLVQNIKAGSVMCISCRKKGRAVTKRKKSDDDNDSIEEQRIRSVRERVVLVEQEHLDAAGIIYNLIENRTRNMMSSWKNLKSLEMMWNLRD